MKMRLVAIGLPLAVLASEAAAQVPFYEGQLSQGQLAYQTGAYSEAVTYLETAAFGLMEDLERYEKAQMLLALSEQGRGNFLEARRAVENVLRAESIRPVYPPSGITEAIQENFEATVDRLAPGIAFPPPARAVPSTPTERDVEANIDRSPLRSLEDTVERIAALTRELRESPADVELQLELARSYLSVGRLDEAREMVGLILETEPEHREARLLRARIAAREDLCEEAIGDFGRAAEAGPLADDDRGDLLVCQVAIGDFNDARETAQALSPEVAEREDVKAALERLGESPQ